MTDADVLKQADALIALNLKAELAKQGHTLTGALESSVHGNVIRSENISVLTGTALYYAGILQHGVRPDRIPYSGNTGSGGTSKYIQALISYWKLRGLDDKEAKAAAFATAAKHKKEGMPTNASMRFSSTGTRTLFIDAVNKAIGPDIDKLVLTGIDKLYNQAFHKEKSETL